MTIKDKIIQAMPIEKDFRPSDVADEVYPHLIRIDHNGRIFNRGCPTVARMLRTIKGVREKPYGVFFAHKEFFKVLIINDNGT